MRPFAGMGPGRSAPLHPHQPACVRSAAQLAPLPEGDLDRVRRAQLGLDVCGVEGGEGLPGVAEALAGIDDPIVDGDSKNRSYTVTISAGKVEDKTVNVGSLPLGP